MTVQHISEIIQRDLNKIKEELLQYKNSRDLWYVIPGISNSGGNLCLHLAGNLRHFIGAVLGNSGYSRERELEFSQKDLDMDFLIQLIDTTMVEVKSTLEQLDPGRLPEAFPKDIGGINRDTHYALLHLMSHLGYHLGQINYHRRIISSLQM
ncbi:MAG: DinB family protein [Bacteroidota bacterium]|nr:DinB family protein [Bacteroidota bacterium]